MLVVSEKKNVKKIVTSKVSIFFFFYKKNRNESIGCELWLWEMRWEFFTN